MLKRKRTFHRVRITVEKPNGDTLGRIHALNAAMFQVLQGNRLIEVEDVSYRQGYMVLLVDANPKRFCLPDNATIKVEIQELEAPRGL